MHADRRACKHRAVQEEDHRPDRIRACKHRAQTEHRSVHLTDAGMQTGVQAPHAGRRLDGLPSTVDGWAWCLSGRLSACATRWKLWEAVSTRSHIVTRMRVHFTQASKHREAVVKSSGGIVASLQSLSSTAIEDLKVSPPPTHPFISPNVYFVSFSASLSLHSL